MGRVDTLPPITVPVSHIFLIKRSAIMLPASCAWALQNLCNYGSSVQNGTKLLFRVCGRTTRLPATLYKYFFLAMHWLTRPILGRGIAVGYTTISCATNFCLCAMSLQCHIFAFGARRQPSVLTASSASGLNFAQNRVSTSRSNPPFEWFPHLKIASRNP